MNDFLKATGVTVVLVLVFLLLSSLITRLESQAIDLKFLLRGEKAFDSSITVIYLDDQEIVALGGWPLKRSYYALLVNALEDLGARVIGFEIFFEEQNQLYPEFDSLLVAVMSRHGNVVLPCYFQRITPEASLLPPEGGLAQGYEYDASGDGSFLSGLDLHLPYPALLHAAHSIGQANLPEEPTVRRVPLFLRFEGKLFPSLSFEVARLFYGTERKNISVGESEVSFVADGSVHRIPLSRDGSLALNYRADISTLNKFSLVEFLQAYDAYRAGLTPRLPVTSVKGKIILVGVIAPGYGKFVVSPYATNFPGIGVHATAVDNILAERFLTLSPPIVQHILAAVFAYIVMVLILKMKELVGLVAVGGFIVIYLVVNFLGFLILSVSLPVVQPLLMAIIGTVGAFALKQRRAREDLSLSESERSLVERKLIEKEKRLVQLEADLRRAREAPSRGSEAALQKEIKRYRDDIRALSVEAGDVSEYIQEAAEGESEREEFEGLVFLQAGKMAEVVDLVKKIAPSDANVFILGESGTGKELIARAIHAKSKHVEKPFVAVNCGALTESLLETELFGHERGAFTGAVKEKAGRFEVADGGTIFLDEITETSESFQVKLLRVLQSGEFERVGGVNTLKVSVRVVAATNKDIKEAIKQKCFREDLFYRLSVFTIQLPPLRERKADVPLLVDHFLKREGEPLKLSSTVMDAFLNYDWKGNVRELESVMKRATILARAEGRTLIRLNDLPEEIAACLQETQDLEEQILILLREKRFSRSAVSETAADLGGLNRGTVAEYFRGVIFKTFFEQEFDLSHTTSIIAERNESDILDRVKKKVSEYLANVVESIDNSKPLDEAKAHLSPKYKNLPQRYHFFLDQLVEAYYKGEWKLPNDIREK